MGALSDDLFLLVDDRGAKEKDRFLDETGRALLESCLLAKAPDGGRKEKVVFL